MTIGPPPTWTTKLHLADSGTGVAIIWIEGVLNEQAVPPVAKSQLQGSEATCQRKYRKAVGASVRGEAFPILLEHLQKPHRGEVLEFNEVWSG